MALEFHQMNLEQKKDYEPEKHSFLKTIAVPTLRSNLGTVYPYLKCTSDAHLTPTREDGALPPTAIKAVVK
jgi:hypothetical protein